MAVTLKTNRQGLAIIDQARVSKNWTALALSWCRSANVSLSTLKRFRERKAIQKDAFIAICRAVGIEDWQQIVATKTENEISVLRRKYRQSKRVIAEEVLSNLDSLDARLDFVEQVFSDDPAEAKRQIEQINQIDTFEQDYDLKYPSHTFRQQEIESVLSQAYSSNLVQTTSDQTLRHSKKARPVFPNYSLRLEANVSIIQIMMEV